MEEGTTVLIIGVGPAGLATSAYLNANKIPNVVLEREVSYASLWRSRSYTKLRLHLGKQCCHLPFKAFPVNAPPYVPQKEFVAYLDNYVSQLSINIVCQRSVFLAYHDNVNRKWIVAAKNMDSGLEEYYFSKFLIVATSENCEGFTPKISGLRGFSWEIIHSQDYKNGKNYKDKNVLVIGCDNSGMEIAYDLSNMGANTSIVVHHPVHILNYDLSHLGTRLLRFMPCEDVDKAILAFGKLQYEDLSQYGIVRPNKGPFFIKGTTGHDPVLDMGTIKMIKEGTIKVLPSIEKVIGNVVVFSNKYQNNFDLLVFAPGYKSKVLKWLKKRGEVLLNEEGIPQITTPSHWKREMRLYSSVFTSDEHFGDAKKIAVDIQSIQKYEDDDDLVLMFIMLLVVMVAATLVYLPSLVMVLVEVMVTMNTIKVFLVGLVSLEYSRLSF